MSHVKIHLGKTEATLQVNGFDLTPHVLAEGFQVELGAVGGEPSRVFVTLAADTLDLDLPASLVEVKR